MSEPSAEQITLATIRQHAEMTMQITAEAPKGTYAAGRRAEARDVIAILDMNGRPAHEPVVFRNPLDD